MEVDSGWIIAFIPRIQGKEVLWHGGLRLFVGISREDAQAPIRVCVVLPLPGPHSSLLLHSLFCVSDRSE